MEDQDQDKPQASLVSDSSQSLTKYEMHQQRMLKRRELMRNLRSSRVRIPKSGGCAPCQAKRKARNQIKND